MRRDLIELARHGDRDAYEAVASAAFDGLYALAYRILRDADRTDDAVQECLIRAWRQIPRLRDPDRFDAWIRRLLVNACHDEERRARRTSRDVGALADDDISARDGSTGVIDRDELARGFQRLTLEHRTVLVMTHYLGMTAREVADTLGIPVGTVQSRLLYALRAMRAGLEADARSVQVAVGGRP